MNHKLLAQTGVTIPEIGLGTWYYRGGVKPLKAGIEAGAKFIDTAESYGTENTVGQAIRGLRREVFLATKVSPRHFRRRDVLAAVEGSLRRLNTDYIDLYQLHWPNHLVPIAETMSAMEELVNQGKVRFIGVSNFSVGDLRSAQAAMNKYKIVANQVRYSLVDRTIERDLLPYCRQQDITVIAHTPLGNNLSKLRARDPQRALDEVASRTSRTVPQVALNWCIAQAGVVAIPKSDSEEHIRENCAASGWQLSEEDVRLLESQVRARSRSRIEVGTRRIARYFLQKVGREL